MAALNAPTVGVAVITHRAVTLLPKSLPQILASPAKSRVLVVNSSSNDGTVELARTMGAETLLVPRRQFNHGATRELARRHLGTDIVVMTTPDAIFPDSQVIGRLVRPIADGTAAVSYARQLPHDGADFFESFPREFNYPPRSELRSIGDVKTLGAYTFFCSDSCAAWSNAALDAIGGFQPTLSLEDTIATAKLLNRGYKIAYCADAPVKHSHRYSLAQEFCRYFDIGYVRALNKGLLFVGGGDGRRGAAFTREMIRYVAREKPQLLPYVLATTAAKILGYRVGYHGRRLPLAIKRRLSGQDYFWESDFLTPSEG
jgi:rhamnosyltransferase